MMPFCGYNMSDYFAHWLELGAALQAGRHSAADLLRQLVPQGCRGQFVWPGFGENMRVLEWMVDRIEGAEGEENVFGMSPRYEDLDWAGLDFNRARFEQVIDLDAGSGTKSWRCAAPSSSSSRSTCPTSCRQVRRRTAERLAG